MPRVETNTCGYDLCHTLTESIFNFLRKRSELLLNFPCVNSCTIVSVGNRQYFIFTIIPPQLVLHFLLPHAQSASYNAIKHTNACISKFPLVWPIFPVELLFLARVRSISWIFTKALATARHNRSSRRTETRGQRRRGRTVSDATRSAQDMACLLCYCCVVARVLLLAVARSAQRLPRV